jgi:hypothetical protein
MCGASAGSRPCFSVSPEAAIAQPEGTIRDVLFPVVSERVLRALVEESRAIGPTYREQLQA